MIRKLLFGDCREMLAAVPDGSVDVLITDPPFGIRSQFGVERRARGRGRRLQFDWDGPETIAMAREGLGIAFRKLKPSASCFVFTGFDAAAEYACPAWEAGFTVKPAAWVKEFPPPAGAGQWWPSAFELAYYGYRRQAARSPWFGDRRVDRSNVFTFDALRNGNAQKLPHPTQKPLGLMRRIVEALTPPAGIVLDCFAGSGTTLAAAEELGRSWIGIEINRRFWRTAKKRLKA